MLDDSIIYLKKNCIYGLTAFWSHPWWYGCNELHTYFMEYASDPFRTTMDATDKNPVQSLYLHQI